MLYFGRWGQKHRDQLRGSCKKNQSERSRRWWEVVSVWVNQQHLLDRLNVGYKQKRRDWRRVLLPLNERRKFQVEQEFFWSGGGEGYKFILIVFSQRCLWDIQVAMSSWQFEMSFQIVKPGTVSLHPSKKGTWKQGWGMGENADLGDLIEDCYCLRELITRGSCQVGQSLESQGKTGYQSPQVTHASSCWDLAESLMPPPLSFPLSVFCSVRGLPLSCHFPLEQSNCEKNVCVLLSLQITSGKKKCVEGWNKSLSSCLLFCSHPQSWVHYCDVKDTLPTCSTAACSHLRPGSRSPLLALGS